MLINPMHKSTYNDRKTGVWFFVAVDGGWSDWSQWSPCTNNINGMQMRTRRCVNPEPQFGGEPCTGPNATVMRGCGERSRCRQGISQLLKKTFIIRLLVIFWVSFTTYSFGNFWPQCFHWPVHQALLGRLVEFDVTRETHEGVPFL